MRALFLLLLILPQAFVPLLHAHVGGEVSPALLHLPGLERYYHTGGSGLSGMAPRSGWEGVVVRSDDGVRRFPQAVPVAAALPVAPLPSTAGGGAVPFRQRPVRIPACLFLAVVLPRAPPV